MVPDSGSRLEADAGADANRRLLVDRARQAFDRLQLTGGFLLARGRFFRPGRLSDWPPGPLGDCYANAAQLVAARVELRYAEGFAIAPDGSIVEGHAWAVTPGDLAVDPTFEGLAYLGVILPDGRWTHALTALNQAALKWRDEGA